MSSTWVNNKNSKRWKQLDYALNHLPNEFSNKDLMNFLEYSWATKGPKGREGRVQKLHHFNSSNISIFLALHEDIEKCKFKIKDKNIYKKRNKNVMDRKI